MSSAEFDGYVAQYARDHARSIRLSGETPDFFAEHKIRVLSDLCRRWDMAAPRVLDFGSGMGASLPPLRRLMPRARVSAADVSGESLRMARVLHGGDEPQLQIADGRIPAEDGAFDIVFAACVFHHIDHDEHVAWLRELRRVTAPGGRAVIFEHNPWNPLTRHAVRTCPFDANAHLLTAAQLRARLAAAGWAEPRTDYHLFFPAALARLRPLEPALRWCGLGAQYVCHARRDA